jgi:sodium/proline symporter
MALSSNPLAILAFIAYLVVVMGVGIFAYFRTRNLSDYVLGGRSLGGAVAALSAGASDMSSWLLMGMPGLIYVSGLREIWATVGLILGAYACWKTVAKRLRIYSEVADDSVTLPAYLDNRFRDSSKLIRMLAALATLVFFTFYIASGLYASGVLLGVTFGLAYTDALWLGTVIIMLYTSVGGFLAVSWTDFFQGIFMLICLLLVPFFAMNSIGGWTIGISKVMSLKPSYLEFTEGLSTLKFISLMAWGLGYFGMPHILVRFMAVKTIAEIPLARMVCMWWMSLSLLGAVLVGIAGAVHFCNSPLENNETVFMALSEIAFTPWLTGIILAAILSSSMCAIDSQMLAASSALTEDFYRALFRRHASQKELMWVGRLMVLVIAGAAIYIARKPSQSIMDLVAFAWAGLASTFGASVVLSLFWRRTTRNGVVMGMLTGAITAIAWRYFGFNKIVYEIVPGMAVSYLGVISISLLDKLPSPEILQEFDLVRTLSKSDNLVKIPKL